MARIRSQIRLTEEQVGAIRRRMAAEGISMAAWIRDAIDEKLKREDASPSRWDRAMSVLGKYRSAYHDVGQNHDRHLADILAEEFR